MSYILCLCYYKPIETYCRSICIARAYTFIYYIMRVSDNICCFYSTNTSAVKGNLQISH